MVTAAKSALLPPRGALDPFGGIVCAGRLRWSGRRACAGRLRGWYGRTLARALIWARARPARAPPSGSGIRLLLLLIPHGGRADEPQDAAACLGTPRMGGQQPVDHALAESQEDESLT